MKLKLEKKHGMIFLAILLLSSTFTAFMSRPVISKESTIILIFNNYEAYELPITISENTTLLQAVSQHYYVSMNNETLTCIRSSCNNNESSWLAFDEHGVLIKPEDYVLEQGQKTYLIYNQTKGNATDDQEAIMDSLQLQ
jgi:hypothetical protein